MQDAYIARDDYLLLLTILMILTFLYLYSIKNHDFRPDLKPALVKESSAINNIKFPMERIINNHLEKRILLNKRDQDVLYNDFHPPEKRQPEHTYPDKYVKRLINIPTRGLPDNYQTVGVLVRKDDEKVLQLFGRQKYPGSTQWEYYVSGMDGNGFPNKMPISIKGEREIEDKQIISLPWLNESKGPFEVNIYKNDTPRYNPYIL